MLLTNEEILLDYVIQMKIETHGVCLKICLEQQQLNVVEIVEQQTPETQSTAQYTKSMWHCFDKGVQLFEFPFSIFNGS